METRHAEWWRRVFGAADRALELAGEERTAFLERYAAEDPALGAELRALLASGEMALPLDGSAAEFAAPIFDALAPAQDPAYPQSPFGPYRILRELGRGGMGAVYLAERSDDQYQKRVALKMLPPWSAGGSRSVQRFLEERQILAGLEHPDIARLVDGGITPDGLPWFAMEFVDGMAIDRYCDELRRPIEERLELFCRVCAAVQYAHRNLVVHRDLKPANILVTAEGQVKLLDFGIAKLLADQTAVSELTVTGERILTPLYASPEQLRGGPISTATDVYALGVLLNVLLTGRYAYRLSSWEQHAVARAVLEQDPERPSLAILRGVGPPHGDAPAATPEQLAAARGSTSAKLRRRLQGDLDAIVLKAIEKEPGRRYTTAEQLESDVRRHLSGLPVVARPASRFYQTRKFVGRHRVSVGIAATVAVLVLTFTTVITVQRSRIRAQAQRIALERDRAEQVSQYILSRLQRRTGPTRQQGVTAREILDSAATRVDEPLFGQPEQRARLMFEMGRAYHRLNLEDRARSLLEGSLAVRRNNRPKRPLEIAETLHLLGAVLLAQGQLGPAERAYTEALALRRRELGARHGDVARTLVGLASVLRTQQGFAEAEKLSREAMAIDQARRGDARADLAQSTGALARILFDKGDYRGAAGHFRRALALVRETHPEEDVEVAGAAFDLAAALKSAGDNAAADSLIRYGLGLYQRLLVASAFMATGQVVLPPAVSGRDGGPAPAQRAAAGKAAAAALPGGVARDDSRIAFSSDRDGTDPNGDASNPEIYVMNADGSDERRLTHNVVPDDNPAWSPDGKQIAFGSARGGSAEIYVMNADGTHQTRLTNPTESGVGARRPAWSPDGKRIVFQSLLRPDIYVINVDGTGLTNITNHPARDHGAAWSPDGRRIAFVSDRDGNEEIYSMDLDGRNLVRLTVNDARDQRPEWSPDARRIAFHSDRDGDQEIYVMNPDGSNPLRLTFNPGEDGHPSWSPDGRRIVFHRRVLGHLQIHVMNADGSDAKQLTELSPGAFNGFPRWGPRRR